MKTRRHRVLLHRDRVHIVTKENVYTVDTYVHIYIIYLYIMFSRKSLITYIINFFFFSLRSHFTPVVFYRRISIAN